MTRETNTGKMVSAVKKVEAPDGSTFDILRHAPEGAAKIRGNALVAMRKIAEEREEGLLRYLETGSGTSAEYATSSAIIHAQNREVKADLVRVAVNSRLAEGHRDSAVSMLSYGKAGELDLPEFGMDFVQQQYDEAVEEGDFNDAKMIAKEVLGNKTEMFKSEEGEQVDEEGWKEKEAQAFQQDAEQVLKQEAEVPESVDWWKLDMLFNECRFREDGYQAKTPSELSQRVAKVYIERFIVERPNLSWAALRDAAEAKLPEEYIKDLKKRLSPAGKAEGKLKNWMAGVRDKLGI